MATTIILNPQAIAETLGVGLMIVQDAIIDCCVQHILGYGTVIYSVDIKLPPINRELRTAAITSQFVSEQVDSILKRYSSNVLIVIKQMKQHISAFTVYDNKEISYYESAPDTTAVLYVPDRGRTYDPTQHDGIRRFTYTGRD